MHGLLEDLEFIVELCKQRALAERSRDKASLQLVGDVVTCCNLLLGVSWLSQQLALYEGSQQDKDRDASSDNEVDEVPEGQAAHLPQGHLLNLQAEPVPLVSQRALKANQHHLQSQICSLAGGLG